MGFGRVLCSIHIYCCVGCVSFSCNVAQKMFMRRLYYSAIWIFYGWNSISAMPGTCTKNFCIWKLISFGVIPYACLCVCVCVCRCVSVQFVHLLADYLDSCQEHKNKRNSHLFDNKTSFKANLMHAKTKQFICRTCCTIANIITHTPYGTNSIIFDLGDQFQKNSIRVPHINRS